jgi:hypothetical protein
VIQDHPKQKQLKKGGQSVALAFLFPTKEKFPQKGLRASGFLLLYGGNKV